ncbi:MAG: hypothetical protein NC177_11015 [Ruminococcus flavefaciens]|nr:hypothetical protein [Ruminococcus flavefaciens]
MNDRKLLEKKKKLQRVRNMLKSTDGIEVIEICDGLNIRIAEYYSCEKVPDSRISEDSDNIYEWITDCMKFRNNMIVYLLCEGVPVKIRITDVQTAVKSLWDAHGTITTAVENLEKVYEVGNDSRDECNYLFDVYYITKA